jgi:tRNA threonylcarbamoyl adenosine modification protein YjeE
MITLELPTVDDTRAFGGRLAGVLRVGDLIVLSGPLGAGKTALAQGIGAGLGVVERIVSPTFVIARVHRSGRVPVVHVDAYRLRSVREVDDLDLEVETSSAVTVVEWGEGLVEQLVGEWLLVTLERADDSESRRVTLEPHGGDWLARLAAIGGDPSA